MTHPIVVDVFAFQEALLLEAVFAIVILAMIWAGFRRWLQYKERIGRLIAEQTAERAAQYGAHMERVEARLEALEHGVADGAGEAPAQIDPPRTHPLPDPALKRDEA